MIIANSAMHACGISVYYTLSISYQLLSAGYRKAGIVNFHMLSGFSIKHL